MGALCNVPFKGFNGDVSGWDVASVTSLKWVFEYACSFDGDLSGWDVSKVQDFSGMHRLGLGREAECAARAVAGYSGVGIGNWQTSR